MKTLGMHPRWIDPWKMDHRRLTHPVSYIDSIDCVASIVVGYEMGNY